MCGGLPRTTATKLRPHLFRPPALCNLYPSHHALCIPPPSPPKLVEQVVDDDGGEDLDAVLLGQLARLLVYRHVKREDDGEFLSL